jgi:hypothetical protein
MKANKCFVFRLLFIFIFFIAGFAAFAQNNCDCYERLMNLSRCQVGASQFKAAQLSAKQASSFRPEDELDRSDCMLQAYVHAMNDSADLTLKYLKLAIERGLDIKELTDEDSGFKIYQNLLKGKKWDDLIAEYPALHNRYKAKLDLGYYSIVVRILGADQRVRQIFDQFRPEDIEALDSLNFLNLTEAIELEGYPSVKKHGFSGNRIEAVFMHQLKNKKVIDLLHKANAQCLCNKSFIALISDRGRLRTGMDSQQFGVWNLYNDAGKFTKIERLNGLDLKRFEYNLVTLEDQAKSERRALPEGYVADKYPENYFCGHKF